MEQFPTQKENVEKPPVLFHASTKNDIETFEPRAETKPAPEDGPAIFATHDKAYATAFLTKWDDSWVQLSKFNETVVMIISDHDRFVEADKGGTLYEMPSENFENAPLGENHLEWKSVEKIKPTKATAFTSALDTMIENGVQVYFVSADEFKKIKSATNQGLSILKELQSENQLRGKISSL